jgi:ribosomal-protein-alanine N-acetyltransferase
MQFLIEPMRIDDVPTVKELETACGLAPWPVAGYVSELKRNDSVALVARTDIGLAGFLLARCSDDGHESGSMEIANICVAPIHRRAGLGKALLEAAPKACPFPVVEILLEVRESNSGAIAFYERMGFSLIATRPGFYRNPDEVALTYRHRF